MVVMLKSLLLVACSVSIVAVQIAPILIGDLGAVLVPHGKDLNGRAKLVKVDHPDIMKRYPQGFPMPAWEAAATMVTDASRISALDPRLAEMDIMAVATFPLEKWLPET